MVSCSWQMISGPEGPSTQYLGLVVPKTILLLVFGTRELEYWVLGPSGWVSMTQAAHVTAGVLVELPKKSQRETKARNLFKNGCELLASF